jgi:hypothetical protein
MFAERYRRYIQSFLLVVPMTGIVTLVNTVIGKGLAFIFTFTTLQKWGVSILIAYPSVLLVMPIAIRLTNRLIKKDI